MNKTDLQPFLKKERSQTDESLICERGKTDEGLFDLRKKTERNTDAIIRDERSEADHARAQSRVDRDAQMAVDFSVHEQRVEVDDNIQSERSSIDAAIKKERAQKEAVLHEFLQKERSETDDNLFQERERTDLAVSNSSKLLSDEVNLHTRTKAELTTRDELMALVSHDLRSPIGAVLSCAEMLLEDEDYAGMSSDIKHWIEFIRRNASTSLRLISDILEMERIAEGKLQLECETSNLAEIIRHANEQHTHTASAKGVLLRSSLPAKLPAVVCDKERIGQVLSNLISNSIKFTPERGTIVVKAEETADSVKVSICDTGIGIPAADQSSIFGRFNQLNKKDRRGLGLGLHICKALIESHSGKIWVESTVGKGSTFFFTIPKQ